MKFDNDNLFIILVVLIILVLLLNIVGTCYILLAIEELKQLL